MQVDYFFSPQSPWTYLGHVRFWNIARAQGASIRVRPVDLGGKVFPVSGGQPLAKRAPQRQAYRLLELQRFSQWLHAPLNPQPKYFPVSGDDAAKLVIAVDQHDGADAAMHIADAVLRAVWVEERNIADEATLAALLAERELPARRLEDAHSQATHVLYERYTQDAIDLGVFGAPSYAIAGEIFWGQDRLDFVERRLTDDPSSAAYRERSPAGIAGRLGSGPAATG
jgi:carboxymethylenebutenolidase